MLELICIAQITLTLAESHNLCYHGYVVRGLGRYNFSQLLLPDTVFKQEIYAYKAKARSISPRTAISAGRLARIH